MTTAAKGRSAVIAVPSAKAKAVMLSPSLTVWTQLSQDWFNDARWEAANPLSVDNWHYRRREVLFAVCFAEAYLFEWTLARLGLDGDKLTRYFPPKDSRGVAEKWAQVPKELRRDGILSSVPVTSKKHNRNWEKLVLFRNGLTHSTASWPDVIGRVVRHPSPRPRLLDLAKIQPGWPLAVAVERVRRFHVAADEPIPAWVATPIPFTGCPSCQRS